MDFAFQLGCEHFVDPCYMSQPKCILEPESGTAYQQYFLQCPTGRDKRAIMKEPQRVKIARSCRDKG